MLKDFQALREKVGSGAPKTVAVACAHDAHTLEAILHAADEGILQYVLIGRKADIRPDPGCWSRPERHSDHRLLLG